MVSSDIIFIVWGAVLEDFLMPMWNNPLICFCKNKKIPTQSNAMCGDFVFIMLTNQQLRSGRQDSNLRPPGPKPGALPDCATPRLDLNDEGLFYKQLLFGPNFFAKLHYSFASTKYFAENLHMHHDTTGMFDKINMQKSSLFFYYKFIHIEWLLPVVLC